VCSSDLLDQYAWLRCQSMRSLYAVEIIDFWRVYINLEVNPAHANETLDIVCAQTLFFSSAHQFAVLKMGYAASQKAANRVIDEMKSRFADLSKKADGLENQLTDISNRVTQIINKLKEIESSVDAVKQKVSWNLAKSVQLSRVTIRKVDQETNYASNEGLLECINTLKATTQIPIARYFRDLLEQKVDCFSFTKDQPYLYFFARRLDKALAVTIKEINRVIDFSVPIREMQEIIA
jgi:uncharacterized protein YoxC